MNPNQRFRRTASNSPKSPNTQAADQERYNEPIYLDEEALQRMIESFGPLEYTQFSTPSHPFNRFESTRLLGDQAAWQGEEWMQPGQSKRKSKSPVAERPTTEGSPGASSGGEFSLPKAFADEEQEGQTTMDGSVERPKETLLEWFDRSVEKELQKRRDQSQSPSVLEPALSPLKKHANTPAKSTTERLAEVSASRIEISTQLEHEFTTELTDAVEKLAKAETMCSYVGALQAAEEASQNVPPEQVEEAAAAGARQFNVEASEVKKTIGGARPVEVIGYVGITRPRYPKQSQ